MKKLFLFALSAVACVAGSFQDNANFVGPKAEQVQAALADLPVSIETRELAPPEGLRVYAAQRAAEEFSRGFYVVLVTTKPRVWRIAVHPEGMVSSEATRVVGVRMADRIRAQDYAGAFIGVAEDLDTLRRESTGESPGAWERYGWWVGGLLAAGLLMVWFLRRARRRADRRRESRFPREDTPVAKYTASWTPPEVEPVRGNASAQRYFDRYTPAERRRMVRDRASTASDTQRQAALDDPFLFYLLMTQQSHASCAHSTPSSSHTSSISASSIEDSDTRRRRSSDDSGFTSSPAADYGGSYDSGSSDSGSSSDSGGSSGSCD
jgi:hypothetical protein